MPAKTGSRPRLPAPVRGFLAGPPKRLLVGGRWVEAASGETFDSIDPCTGAVLARASRAGKEDADRAVAAARKAFEAGPWRRITPSERGRLLWRLADLLEASREPLAYLEALDGGKLLGNALHGDLPLAADCFRYYAGWATKIEGATIPVSTPYAPGARFLNYTLREPAGVAAQIIPWNFPLLMAAWKLAPALAAGCTCVLKPAEQTPLSAVRLGELVLEAGFPEGVVNILTGFGDAGAALAAHPGVDKVAFTGSTEVGREVVRASAGNVKRVSLELGGKSPNIVLPDADLDAAIPAAADAIFYHHGQCCTAGSRLLVHREVYRDVVDGVVERARRVRLGDVLDRKASMGPLVSREQLDRVQGYVESGRREGARVATGGGRPGGALARGFYVEPTVFERVRPGMRIEREEIFGPVVCAIPFSDLAEAVALANASPYGLAAGVWTRDASAAHRLAERLRAGTVWINAFNDADSASPVGGFGESGYGRELGRHALDLYTETKSVWVGLGAGTRD